MTSPFCTKIYNGFLLDKGGEQYFREYLLAKIDLPRFHDKYERSVMADGMSEAKRTREAFNAAIKDVCETFGIENFHEEQQKAIDLFFDAKDVFVSLPTGYGKSIIFQSIPVIASSLWKKPCTIFIVSPLKALMEDQVNYLNGLGLKAVALTEDSEDSIIERVIDGEYSHVYGSPESFLSKDAWRDVFSTSSFRTHLIGVAIDEAHCISHWYVLLQFLMHIYFPSLKYQFLRVHGFSFVKQLQLTTTMHCVVPENIHTPPTEGFLVERFPPPPTPPEIPF